MKKFTYRYCVQCGGTLVRRLDPHGTPRLACRRCGALEYQNPKPTAALLLVCGRELLLAKRARPPYKDWWDLPGGFVERGETLERALRREAKEELGIRLGNLIFFASVTDVYAAGEPTIECAFIARVSRKPAVRPADDVSEARWFPLGALPTRIAFRGQRRLVAHFVKSL